MGLSSLYFNFSGSMIHVKPIVYNEARADSGELERVTTEVS